MKVNIGRSVSIDVIEFEPFLGDDIEKYKTEFEKWYFELIHIGNLPYGVQRSSLKYKNLDGIPIVDWMNEVAPGCNARIIAKNLFPGQEDKNLPYMCFFQ